MNQKTEKKKLAEAVSHQTDLPEAEALRVAQRRARQGRCPECGGRIQHVPPCSKGTGT